jgi:disulfide bond formation protein DsbB
MQHHMTGWIERRTGNLFGLLACAGLLSLAYYAQYGLGLEPCPLCILQRLAVLIVGLLFLAAVLHNPGDRGARVYGVLIDLTALAGIVVAARQIWIINQPPGSVAECGASLDYMMDVLPLHEVLGKILTGSGECAKIDWEFLGLNMPTWVLICLVLVGGWGLVVNFFARRAGSP